MPIYVYRCSENNQIVEVIHGINGTVETWEELCKLAGIEVGETAPQAAVQKLITPVGVAIPTSDSEYKSAGFTKLVKRETGVYENVTAKEGESRFIHRS
jgi:predicted nucleic acid-binding Zn ribbon protein